MKNYLTIFTMIICFGMISCGDSNDAINCSTNFNQEFTLELNNISTAVQAFGVDQSTANCNALKDAYNAYLDGLETWEDCAIEFNNVTEWNAAIDSARESINQLIC